MTNAETGGEGALVISVQIPQGCEPGDSLSFEANGQSFTIEVPAASVAGEVLQIKLAGESSAANENSDSDDCDRITIETATGSKITIVQEISAQTSSKSRSDGTHQMLWNATRFIVNWLGTPDFRREILRSKHVHSVLELGAGHGILGMAFVDVLSKTLTPDKILKLVLTDVEEALPQLESNIRLNREVLGEKVDASALVLEWHKQSFSQANNKFDYILGSDLLYNLSVIPDLVTTIRRLLSKSTKILFSIRVSTSSYSSYVLQILDGSRHATAVTLVVLNILFDRNSYHNVFAHTSKIMIVAKAIGRKTFLFIAERYY